VKKLFKLIFNDKNESKFNISYNLNLKLIESIPLNFSHWKLPNNIKNAPQFFHLKIIIEFLKRNLLNIQLFSHYKSKQYKTISMHPYSSRVFQYYQKHNSWHCWWKYHEWCMCIMASSKIWDNQVCFIWV
jgi:hypothetical protein